MRDRRITLFEVADRIADREYLRLEQASRPLALRRLGALTRKAAPVPGQRRRWDAGRSLAAMLRRRGRLRRRPLSTAIAYACVAVAGALPSYVALGLGAALAVFVVVLVIGVVATYAGNPAENPDAPSGSRQRE